MKTLSMKITAVLPKTGPNKGNCKPDEPENHRKERKEGKGTRAREKKKTSNSL